MMRCLAGQTGENPHSYRCQGNGAADGQESSGKNRWQGDTLRTSLDISIQEYVQQAALKVMEEKQAERVSVLLDESAERGNLCLRQCAGV